MTAPTTPQQPPAPTNAMAAALANALGLKTEAADSSVPSSPPENSPAAANTDTQRPAHTHRPAESGRSERTDRNGDSRARRASKGHNTGKNASQRPARAERQPARPTNPLLVQLAQLHPTLFGDVPLPLKRGIFQDLMAAHPGVFDKAALKEALGFHTRSTRYLRAMSEGMPRHDLNGQPVEAVAPEHAYHALLEVFKRRHARTGEDVRAALQTRMLQMLDASGLHRDDFAQRVRNKDEAANALLDGVLAHAAERAAKDEALHRAHASSGLSVEAFAQSYGLETTAVAQALARAALVRLPVAAPAAEPVSEPTEPTPTEAPSAPADAACSS